MTKVTKRDGTLETLNLDKIHKMITDCSEGLDVSVSQVELSSEIQFYDGIKTSDIQKVIVKTAADLISVDSPDYQYLAARLAICDIRKRVYGEFIPCSLYDLVVKNIKIGVYADHIIHDYSKQEIEELGNYIDHERDKNLAYAAVKQMEGKYLVQNRVTGQLYESPQMLYMLVGMYLFSVEKDKQLRMEKVKKWYDATSTFAISLPTPIMGGVRTPTRQFSSCTLIESGDSLDSINAASSSIVKYVSQRAGIGINAGAIRAEGSEIRGGAAVHTGCIPFYKHFQSAVKSCSQGSIRGGAATLFYPMWHLEFESLVVLKNNRGVEENRVRHMDYGVQINKLMYQRLIDGGYISLFSPSDVEGLYDAFFQDQQLFEKLYVEAENNPAIRKKKVKAVEAFSWLMNERASTGRIYIQNVDHCNVNSPFDESVSPCKQSNLCMEVVLPTKPLDNVNDEKGEVALCTLAAFNLGKLTSLDDFENLSELVVEALDNLLDYQSYPLPAAYRSTMDRRTLGVGVIDFAHYLAKNGVKYSDGSANNLVHSTFEAMQYYLIKASVKLAKQRGQCPKFKETKWAKGILPVDRYKDSVDKLHTQGLNYDWDSLRKEVVKYGMRNSTLSALMPAETSAQISNSTNGIEPPRGYVSVKASKDGILKQVVPELELLKDNYELLWEIPNNKGYLELVAIMQKFVCQSISANTNYDPSRYESGKVPMKQLLQDLLTSYKLGVKTLYYHNTRDGASDTQDEVVIKEDDSCDSGACKI